MPCLEVAKLEFIKVRLADMSRMTHVFLRVQKRYGCKMFGGTVAPDRPPVCSSLVFLTVKEDL